MGYSGQVFRIPLGSRGLMTDEVQTRMPIDALLEAKNVSFVNGLIEKEPGALRWNNATYGSSVIAFTDFWPNDVTQRVTVLTADGVLRKHIDRLTSYVVGPDSLADAQTLTIASDHLPQFIAGGVEASGTERKLFLATGTTQLQVMTGDFLTRRNVAQPALDWTTSFPTGGLIHNGRLCVFGNGTSPHTLYMSNPDDHEDFRTAGAFLQFPVFPGEGEVLLQGYNFKGRLFLLKYPYGVYYLDDTSSDFTQWEVRKLTGAFGGASAFAAFEALNDFFAANSTGSITQMSATLNFGSMENGNLLRNLRNEGYMRQTTARFGYRKRYAIYYEDKKLGLVTYQSSGGTQNDRTLVIDFNSPDNPRVSWSTKDQMNCLGLLKDTVGINRPAYGSSDGYLYQGDWPTYEVADRAYEGAFQTIHHDFGASDGTLAERMKLYDFIEVTFQSRGAWSLLVDVFIDGIFTETIPFKMTKLNQTSHMPQSFRRPLHGSGRRISFRCHNETLNEGFGVSEIAVYFRPAGQAQKE
jgi:hypothetical protein